MGGDNVRELKLFEDYMRQRNLSNNTIDSYLRNLRLFFEHTKLSVSEVTKEDIKGYLKYLRENGMAVSSINQKLSALKTFYRFCVKENITKTNPAEVIESGKVEKRLPVTLDITEAEMFIEKANNLRDAVIFEILYGTGVRREELISIRTKDINFKRKYIRIFGKGSKERIVPIHDTALKKIKELIKTQNSEWLFPSIKHPGQHISKRRLNEIVKAYSDKLGFEGITPHKFRHTFGTLLYNNGADIKAIQDMMGHESIDTTNIYAKVSIKRNLTEYLKCHPRAATV